MKPKWPGIIWNSCSKAAQGPRILGINPWIYDFAAYNLWSRPAGLLAALDMLRSAGATVALLDCLDKTWTDVPWPAHRSTGRGHYPKTHVPRPDALRDVPRRYSRYGQDLGFVRQVLQRLSPPPDLILVTTAMTYWYPGAAEAIGLVRDIFPQVPVALGGVYATLCPDHAQGLGADRVVSGRLEESQNWAHLWSLLGESIPSLPDQAGLTLALDLYTDAPFSIILGSRGCPFRCAYCASHSLFSGFRQAEASTLLAGVQAQYQQGIRDFAFYDDALLVQPDVWLWPLLDWATGKGLRLHTPNAMHVRYLSPAVCKRLKGAGLQTVRLGLETEDFTHRLDAKLSREEWLAGVAALREAGFTQRDVGAYILFGLPGQDLGQVERSIAWAKASSVRPELAYFTPIPGSALFERACALSEFPLAAEPLCQNNSIWPCVPGGYSWEQARYWRDLVS